MYVKRDLSSLQGSWVGKQRSYQASSLPSANCHGPHLALSAPLATAEEEASFLYGPKDSCLSSHTRSPLAASCVE